MSSTLPCLFASAAPFDQSDLIVILAFVVDMVLGPASALVLAFAFLARGTGRAWAIVLGGTGALNLLVSGTMLALDEDGLGPLYGLIVLQVVLSAGLLLIVSRLAWRARVFGKKPSPDANQR